MELLILNAGSSSLKFSLYQMPKFKLLHRGICERIGLDESFIFSRTDSAQEKKFVSMKNHLEALKTALNSIVSGTTKVLDDINNIEMVGHMFVHGGELFKPTIATKEVVNYLSKSFDYAPVHMPKNVAVLKECMKLFPNVPNSIYFDSNFHSTMPDYAYTYAINSNYTKKWNIRRYGFHGSSHEFMKDQVLGFNKENKKIITCHLGNGCSISAIKNGKCIDTTMGFTPLEGLMMGTRSGDIDPSIVTFLSKKFKISADEVVNILNEESGLKGISGFSDLRDVEKGAKNGDKNCKLALEMYIYSIVKHIGAYISVLEGVDAIAFGGGVGENSGYVRSKVLEKLEYLGLKYDKELNKIVNRLPDKKISLPGSTIEIYIISTNEELVVAKKLYQFYLKNRKNFNKTVDN